MKDYIVSALKPLVPYIPLLPKPVLSKLQYVPVLPAPVRAVAPYLPLLPTPLLTLGPTVAFHIASHSSPSPTAFFTASTTHPLHAPLLFLLSSIPFTYTLGLITNNVSWVDRWWPFYTPFCSFLLVLHMVYNEHAKVLTHNAPRAFLLFGLQLCWSIRLLSHARKRGFYDLTGEDYRYTQVRKIIPKWAFALLHLFVVAIAQPVLIFSLCLPVHAVMSMPPSELSAGPISALSIPFSSLIPFLPISRISAPPSTPILNLADLFLTALSVGLLYVEWTSDRQMYEFQESKHNAPKDTKRIHPGPFTPRSMFTGAPQPASFPVSHNPGFPTKSLWRYSRHPNFAAEQLFWFTQALFVVGAAESSGMTRSGWVGGSVFGPAFALSLLFCGSTFLTEWISGCKYPSYSKYRQLVGQFLPQETAILWLWARAMGTRAKLERELYQDQEDPKRKQKKSS